MSKPSWQQLLRCALLLVQSYYKSYSCISEDWHIVLANRRTGCGEWSEWANARSGKSHGSCALLGNWKSKQWTGCHDLREIEIGREENGMFSSGLWFIDIGRHRSFWECLEIDIDVGYILLGWDADLECKALRPRRYTYNKHKIIKTVWL